MPLIKCPECGKKVSDRAVSCPECGFMASAEEKFTVKAGFKFGLGFSLAAIAISIIAAILVMIIAMPVLFGLFRAGGAYMMRGF